jgi:hypothetical protein
MIATNNQRHYRTGLPKLVLIVDDKILLSTDGTESPVSVQQSINYRRKSVFMDATD